MKSSITRSLSVLFVAIIFSPIEDVSYCGRQFVQKQTKIFLKDEGIFAYMTEVFDKKTNNYAFGYIVEAFRNDTNFIYSKISQRGDTIIRKEFRNFRITNGSDSVITRFICVKTGFKMYDIKRYWEGNKVYDTLFNLFLIRYKQ